MHSVHHKQRANGGRGRKADLTAADQVAWLADKLVERRCAPTITIRGGPPPCATPAPWTLAQGRLPQQERERC